MSNAVLGIDMGTDRLKLALIQDGQVKKALNISMPENMIRNGRVTSPDAMAELLRDAIRGAHLRVTQAALVLPDEILYLRNVFMPHMTEEQLAYNLPYEFNDYITGELKDYLFDYSVISLHMGNPNGKRDESDEPLESDAEFVDNALNSMELLAVACPAEVIESAKEMMHKAGLRLVRAAPVECAFISLIRAAEYGRMPKPLEYCFLDLGNQSIRMYMFKGVRHQATRALDVGLSALDQVVAEAFSVDVHVAHTYLMNNYEDCQHQDYCIRAYNNIAVELVRALNFFRFSNPSSHLSAIWIFGGGAVIEPLREVISQTMDLRVHRITGMMPKFAEDIEDIFSFAPAIGITAAFPGADKSFIKMERNMPFKVLVNLATVGEKHLRLSFVIPVIVLAVLCVCLLFKFAVLDRLAAAAQARQEVAQVQAQVDLGYKQIEGFGELNETYAHYTTSGMTEEELKRANRTAVMEMLRLVVMPRTPLDSWSLSGNRLTLSINGATLEEINQTTSAIRADPLVDYCTVNTAATDDRTEAQNNVTANIVIYLKENQEMNEG